MSPDKPIRSCEFLRGRGSELDRVILELNHFNSVPFIFGNRGVGKTSLARTAAQLVNESGNEHLYVACAPGASMLTIFREIAHDLLSLAVKTRGRQAIVKQIELNISSNPGIKLTVERHSPQISQFVDVNEAVRTLRDIDKLLPKEVKTVVVIDELEELNNEDRVHLAYLIKQLGDQEFTVRFLLVGIAENVQELIGAHASVPRYTHEVSLSPLIANDLIEVVSDAGKTLEIGVSHDILCKIAIIGNGYPHFAHLIGKSIFLEAIVEGESSITQSIYKKGIFRAVAGSTEELKISYDKATQRQDDYYKYLIWALADSNAVDIRIDDWVNHCKNIAGKYHWKLPSERILKDRIGKLSLDRSGNIVNNTSTRYGKSDKRYRYKRFNNNLMRGHVRLMAESEGVILGEDSL